MTEVKIDDFGKTKDGHAVTRFSLQNKTGLKVKLLTFGALISEVHVPGKDGEPVDICLGFDNMKDYEVGSDFFIGAICGRVANRIAGGQFRLDDKTYQLHINDPGGCLHGGKAGYYKKMWSGEEKDGKVVMTYISPDGEENFPGQLTVRVTYSLDEEENNLRLEYEATTTKPTIVNLTSHGYFNLGGHDLGHIKDQEITVNADEYIVKDDTSIPTGEIRDVTGTVFDLRKPTAFDEVLTKVPGGQGFDHTFQLKNNGRLELAARVRHPGTGVVLECHSTEPSVHLYTSHFFPEVTGKGGASYRKNGSFCLEAQHHPDSINHANFPNTILRPGEVYTQTTVYKFKLEP